MPGLFAVQVVGFETFAARLRGLGAELPAAFGEELYPAMVRVMAESQRIVPYDEGDLHDSGEVDRPQLDGATVSVSLHYGGGNVDYALVQHERLDYHHTPPGQAKYLETPLNAWASGDATATATRAIRRAARR